METTRNENGIDNLMCRSTDTNGLPKGWHTTPPTRSR
jgi:hypothetical protein